MTWRIAACTCVFATLLARAHGEPVVQRVAGPISAVVARFADRGAVVKRNSDGQVVDLDLRKCAVSNEDLAQLAGLEHLVALRLSGKSGATTVDDAGMRHLAGLTGLRALMLDHLWVSGEGLAALAPLGNLEELTLAQTLVGDDAAEAITAFSRLRRLRLAGTSISGAGLAKLAKLPALADLDVSEAVQIDDAALEHVGRMAGLRRLNLWRVPVGDAGIAQLAGLEDLEWLNLDNTQLTDAGLEAVGGLRKLQTLYLGSTAVSNAGLGRIAGLTALESLSLQRTAVDAAAVRELQQRLPKTTISLEDRGDE